MRRIPISLKLAITMGKADANYSGTPMVEQIEAQVREFVAQKIQTAILNHPQCEHVLMELMGTIVGGK